MQIVDTNARVVELLQGAVALGYISSFETRTSKDPDLKAETVHYILFPPSDRHQNLDEILLAQMFSRNECSLYFLCSKTGKTTLFVVDSETQLLEKIEDFVFRD